MCLDILDITVSEFMDKIARFLFLYVQNLFKVPRLEILPLATPQQQAIIQINYPQREIVISNESYIVQFLLLGREQLEIHFRSTYQGNAWFVAHLKDIYIGKLLEKNVRKQSRIRVICDYLLLNYITVKMKNFVFNDIKTLKDSQRVFLFFQQFSSYTLPNTNEASSQFIFLSVVQSPHATQKQLENHSTNKNSLSVLYVVFFALYGYFSRFCHP